MLRSTTAAKPERLPRALAGLRRYQEAVRAPPPAPLPAIAERHGAALRDYGGDGPDLLFIPSLINPPTVLDLPDKSLLRWLAAKGRRVLLLDWGPADGRRELSVAGHVEEVILPFLRSLPAPADLAGYCLGGTMANAAAVNISMLRLAISAKGLEAKAPLIASRIWVWLRCSASRLASRYCGTSDCIGPP